MRRSCYDDMPFSLVLFRYLWPFWLFKDASRGDRDARAAAYRHNRNMRIYLPGYLMRWMFSAATFAVTAGFGSLSTAQAASQVLAGCVRHHRGGLGHRFRLQRVRAVHHQLHLFLSESERALTLECGLLAAAAAVHRAVSSRRRAAERTKSRATRSRRHRQILSGPRDRPCHGPRRRSWLERPERESEEQPQLLIDALEIKPGQTIADLGAGSGYYSFRIAPLVGQQGKVLAIDVEPRMLRIIADAPTRAASQTSPRCSAPRSDPNLPPNSVDLLFMVDVYHELDFPFEMMMKVREALKPGGRVALVEYRAEDPKVMIKAVHKMSERQVVRELEAAGFRHLKTVRTLPLQHLVIFEK